MDNLSKQEKEFLRKVYCKANFLESKKNQEEIIKLNEKINLRKKIKDYAALSLLIAFVIFINVYNDFDMSIMMFSSMFLMLFVSYYEFKLNM